MTVPILGAPRAGAASQIAMFTRRQWLVALTSATAVALVTGLPTDLVPNPFYRRMTPILWWNYPVWAATAVLAGLVTATYVRRQPGRPVAGAAASGGLLSFLAVGCPVCNKVVVWLIGISGALSFFAPIQPYLGVAGLALLAVSLIVRLRQIASCPLPATPADTAA